jgi:hypothetical protein
MGKKSKKIKQIEKTNILEEENNNFLKEDKLEEDYIRPPIPTYNDRLINDEYNIFEDRFEMNDENDDILQQAILESKKEYLDKCEEKKNYKVIMKDKIDENIKLLIELLDIINLLENSFIKNIIKIRIEDYINLENENIVLEYDIYDEIIEHINNNYKSSNKQDILKLFVCDDEEERQNYLNLIELSKQTHEEEENIKKEKEEIERQQIIELNRRNELFLKINLKLLSLSNFDKNILELKKRIEPKIRDFIDGKNYTLKLNKNDTINFISFLDSIRIENETKNKILKLIENT